MSTARRASARFESHAARIAMVVAGICFLCIGLAGVFVGGEHTFASMLAGAAGLVLVIRGHASATVLVEADRVVLVGFARRREIELADLRSAEVRARTPGWEAYSPEFLVLNLSDGRSIQFKELNSRHRFDRASVVDEAVAYINARLVRAPAGTAAH